MNACASCWWSERDPGWRCLRCVDGCPIDVAPKAWMTEHNHRPESWGPPERHEGAITAAPFALVAAALVLASGSLVAAVGLHTQQCVLERQVEEMRGRVAVLESPAARAIEEGRRDLAGAVRTVGPR